MTYHEPLNDKKEMTIQEMQDMGESLSHISK